MKTYAWVLLAAWGWMGGARVAQALTIEIQVHDWSTPLGDTGYLGTIDYVFYGPSVLAPGLTAHWGS